MIWGSMAANGIGELELVSGMINGTKYIDVLEKKMLSGARFLFAIDNRIFYDDNALCHRAKKVQPWYRAHQVETLKE